MIFSSSNSASRPGRPIAVRAALAVGAALVIAVVSGCGAGKGTSAGHEALPTSPIKALDLAASQRVNSLAATVSVKASGLTLNETVNEQLRPTTLIDLTLKGLAIAGSAPTNIEAILNSKALYLKDSALANLTHKPWVKITLAQLSSKTGVNFGSLLQQVENANPENQVKLFTISKNVHIVGSQRVDGVATTEYAGTYLPSEATAKLPASLRKLLGPVLQTLGNTPVKFRVWIDAQHLTRKGIVDETVLGKPVVTTFNITSVNQPVSVSLPAPSEVTSMP